MANNSYEHDEIQRVIDSMESIAPEGFKGGIIMSADGQKTKNLSIDVEQAKLIRDVVSGAPTVLTGRAKACPSVSVVVTTGAFDEIKSNYDVSSRVNVTDEVTIDTRSIPESELANMARIMKVDAEEIEECYVVVYHECQDDWSEVIDNYVFEWAVSDQDGHYVLETDDKQEALDYLKEKNEEMSSQDDEGSCALMMKDPDGEGYTLYS
jgi:hypothetical protein